MGTTHHLATRACIAIFIYVFCNFFTFGNSSLKDPCPEKVGTCNPILIESNAPNIATCLPCSQEYLTSSYFDSHNSLHDSNFIDFVSKDIGSNKLCKWLGYTVNGINVSDLNRHLIGEGSHRQLVSKVRFTPQLDVLKWLDDHICEAIIIERFLTGVFADPYELQHLVERKAFLAADVFGDTNLELPSALSNRSIVEIHVAIACNIASKSCETVIQLPLHARYPPLCASAYAEVMIGKPDLFLRCRPKVLQNETCSWAVSNLDSRSNNNVTWQIPCGNETLTRIVSTVTFVSALVCSLSIVFSAICFSRK